MIEGKRERKRSSRLLSMIHKVSSVGIRRDKNKSSLPQQGLCVHTKKEGFHQRYKGGYLGKSSF